MKTTLVAWALALGLSTHALAATPPDPSRTFDTLGDLDPANNVHLSAVLSAARVLCGEREALTQETITTAWFAAYDDGAEEGETKEEVDASISRVMNTVLNTISRSKPATFVFCSSFGERLP